MIWCVIIISFLFDIMLLLIILVTYLRLFVSWVIAALAVFLALIFISYRMTHPLMGNRFYSWKWFQEMLGHNRGFSWSRTVLCFIILMAVWLQHSTPWCIWLLLIVCVISSYITTLPAKVWQQWAVIVLGKAMLRLLPSLFNKLCFLSFQF